MTDYLDRVVARARGDAPRVAPRLPSMFEAAPESAAVAPESAAVNGLVFPRHLEPEDARPRAATMPPDQQPITQVSVAPFEEERRSEASALSSYATEALSQPTPRERPVAPERQIQGDGLTPQLPVERVERLVEQRRSVLVVRGAPAASSAPADGSNDDDERTQVESVETGVHPLEPRHHFITPAMAPMRMEPRHHFIAPAMPPTRTAETSPMGSLVADTAPTGPPTIKITIGRIDVRAITPPAATPRSSSERQPRLSLDDYLKQRSGGRP